MLECKLFFSKLISTKSSFNLNKIFFFYFFTFRNNFRIKKFSKISSSYKFFYLESFKVYILSCCLEPEWRALLYISMKKYNYYSNQKVSLKFFDSFLTADKFKIFLVRFKLCINIKQYKVLLRKLQLPKFLERFILYFLFIANKKIYFFRDFKSSFLFLIFLFFTVILSSLSSFYYKCFFFFRSSFLHFNNFCFLLEKNFFFLRFIRNCIQKFVITNCKTSFSSESLNVVKNLLTFLFSKNFGTFQGYFLTTRKFFFILFLSRFLCITFSCLRFSASEFIFRIRPLLLDLYFQNIFSENSQIDSTLFFLYKFWILKKKSKTNKTYKLTKFFPKNQKYFFHVKIFEDNFVFCGEYIKSKKNSSVIFLPKLTWL